MRRFPLVVIVVVGMVAWTLLASPRVAHAELTGPCQGQATITGADGGTYEAIDPKAKTGVYVPIAGSAAYTGSIGVSPPPAGRPISGSVALALPNGGGLPLKSWSDDNASRTQDSGTITWSLPAATPRGIEMTVSGSHADLQNCSGSITVKLAGGLTDSTTGMVSVVLTALAGLGVLFAAAGKR